MPQGVKPKAFCANGLAGRAKSIAVAGLGDIKGRPVAGWRTTTRDAIVLARPVASY
jgi:hypothetical protein